jgi:hypothetical protein
MRASRSTGGALTGILLVLCIILGPLTYWELEQQDGDFPEVTAMLDPPNAKPIVELQTIGFEMPPRENYAEVLARPPFSQTRRPAPAGASEKAVDQPLAVTVVGTILTTDGRRALIEHGEPTHVTPFVEGQGIDGWTIKSIRQAKIILVRAGVTREIKVKGNSPPTPPPSNPASPRLTQPGVTAPIAGSSNATSPRLTQSDATAPPVPPPSQTIPSRLTRAYSLVSPAKRSIPGSFGRGR